MFGIERGIREVCNEALDILHEELPSDNDVFVRKDIIIGYFTEILSILDEMEDDSK